MPGLVGAHKCLTTHKMKKRNKKDARKCGATGFATRKPNCPTPAIKRRGGVFMEVLEA